MVRCCGLSAHCLILLMHSFRGQVFEWTVVTERPLLAAGRTLNNLPEKCRTKVSTSVFISLGANMASRCIYRGTYLNLPTSHAGL
ncbi:hypothetical protein F5Y19DRAFT_445399 [Xylariaceae sp. FL1651]|nr:hypothetical protein F5Y19DRAFT_445399 [Xylariaceae sp. FL1651]